MDDIVQVQINQNLIGILIADRGASQGSHFTLLNWKTGEPIVVSVLYPGFVFFL